jgi:hypothetical protein
MPTIQDASIKITNFPNKFASPFGNDDIVPLYSSVPLKSPVEGCLDCVVCGSSPTRYQIISNESGIGSGGGGVIITPTPTPPAPPSTAYYYTNAANNYDWGTLGNWNTKSDGSGLPPTEIPWSNTDNSTTHSDLIDASDNSRVGIGGSDESYSISPLLNVTGSCNIYGVSSDILTTIYGGTFTGNDFLNAGYIRGGTFTGDNFLNARDIHGGTFTGNNFISPGMIDGGTFTVDGFINAGAIFGGTFNGTGYINNNYVCAPGWPCPQSCPDYCP